MKKKILIGTITFLTFTVSVYALTNGFNFDSKKLTFSVNSKKDNIVNSFKSEYNLSTSISSENEETKKIIMELSKKLLVYCWVILIQKRRQVNIIIIDTKSIKN